jgi:hypothetical protein
MLKNDVVNSFVALGGMHDHEGNFEDGKINLAKIKEVVKREFDMEIDLMKLGIGDDDDDQEISFKDFMELMSS